MAKYYEVTEANIITIMFLDEENETQYGAEYTKSSDGDLFTCRYRSTNNYICQRCGSIEETKDDCCDKDYVDIYSAVKLAALLNKVINEQKVIIIFNGKRIY